MESITDIEVTTDQPPREGRRRGGLVAVPIRIRRATPADEAAIDQWQRSIDNLDEYLPVDSLSVRDAEAVRQRFQNWLKLPREKKVPPGWERIDLVAVDDDGTICGFAALNFGVTDRLTGLPEAYVSELHVWPEYRSRGVAKGLLEMSEAYALQRGVTHLSLHVAAANTPALQLYRAAGFQDETIKLTKRVTPHE